jgi:hypothetical protein
MQGCGCKKNTTAPQAILDYIVKAKKDYADQQRVERASMTPAERQRAYMKSLGKYDVIIPGADDF